MELDDLKELLNKKMEEPSVQLQQQQIQYSIHARTTSVLGKIKRGIYFEIICTVVFVLLFACVALFSSVWELRIYFGSFSFIIALFLPFLLILLKKINNQIQHNFSVLENLHNLIATLQLYMKRYYQLGMVLIPVCFVFALFLGYHNGRSQHGNMLVNLGSRLHMSTTKTIIVSVVYLVLLWVAVHFINKWYLNKLYGKYLNQLREIVNLLQAV